MAEYNDYKLLHVLSILCLNMDTNFFDAVVLNSDKQKHLGIVVKISTKKLHWLICCRGHPGRERLCVFQNFKFLTAEIYRHFTSQDLVQKCILQELNDFSLHLPTTP